MIPIGKEVRIPPKQSEILLDTSKSCLVLIFAVSWAGTWTWQSVSEQQENVEKDQMMLMYKVKIWGNYSKDEFGNQLKRVCTVDLIHRYEKVIRTGLIWANCSILMTMDILTASHCLLLYNMWHAPGLGQCHHSLQKCRHWRVRRSH